MKKKYLNIILVVILACIWGAIIKKYFGNSNDYANLTELKMQVNTYDYGNSVSKDTFQMLLVNKNPFKAFSSKKTVKQVTTKVNITKSTALKKRVDITIMWPKLSYHGFVKGHDKKTKLVLFKVNNRLYRKREKGKVNELVIVKAYEDSLVLSNKNEQKTIYRINETL